jgi:hypothetical protein
VPPRALSTVVLKGRRFRTIASCEEHFTCHPGRVVPRVQPVRAHSRESAHEARQCRVRVCIGV